MELYNILNDSSKRLQQRQNKLRNKIKGLCNTFTKLNQQTDYIQYNITLISFFPLTK